MAAVSFAFLLLVIIRSQFRCLVLPQPVIMSTFSAAFDALYEHRHLLTTEDFELRKAELRAQWPLLGGSVAATATNITGCSGSLWADHTILQGAHEEAQDLRAPPCLWCH